MGPHKTHSAQETCVVCMKLVHKADTCDLGKSSQDALLYLISIHCRVDGANKGKTNVWLIISSVEFTTRTSFLCKEPA